MNNDREDANRIDLSPAQEKQINRLNQQANLDSLVRLLLESSSGEVSSVTPSKPANEGDSQQKKKAIANKKLELNSLEKLKPTSKLTSALSTKYGSLASEKEVIEALEKLAYIREQISAIQAKIGYLETKIDEPTDIINPLLPLINELLQHKVSTSQEAILAAIEPVIDTIIQGKAQKDLEGISVALSDILPTAITQEIQNYPQKIAKSLAPELALTIQEQITLDEDAISHALGSEMGKAIKAQIILERDAMVDALYPVIGSTISKYMEEVLVQINQKVENNLSFEGIKRKIKAKIEGVSEAELIFQESINFTVQAVFLIHKASGLVIQEVQTDSQHKLDSNMLAGLLTAIRSFVKDCIEESDSGSEVNEIEYGNSKILIEVAGYCYLAIVVRGKPSQQYIQTMRNILGEIVLKYDRKIQQFNGDRSTVPQQIKLFLLDLIQTESKTVNNNKSKLSLILAIVTILGIIFIPLLYFQYRHYIATNIETKAAQILDAAPELSIYRIVPEVNRGKLTLTGRVPNSYLKQQVTETLTDLAANKSLELNNQVKAIIVPPDPTVTRAEISRVTNIFNQLEGVSVSSQYEDTRVAIQGNVPTKTIAEQINRGFQQIPGVVSVTSTIQIGLPTLGTRIYFDSNSTQVSPKAIKEKIPPIAEFLQQNAQLHLRIIGYSDSLGSLSHKQNLAVARAKEVEQALVREGIKPQRLEIGANLEFPVDPAQEQPLWLSRYVRFETFIP